MGERRAAKKQFKNSKRRGHSLRLRRLDFQPILSIALGLAVFVFSFLVPSLLTPIQPSSAQEITVSNHFNGNYIRLSASDSLALDIDTSPSGTLASVQDTINVVTNVSSGYKLYLSVDDDNIYNTKDINKVSGHFSPVATNGNTSAVLDKDTWGYTLATTSTPVPEKSSTFSPVPTSPAVIKTTDNRTSESGDDTNIYYGFNASSALPAGDYVATITYTAFAEDTEEFATMQDFSLETCSAMADGELITLTDARDGKAYNVTKMRDGHCWMTQNLRLDGGRTLTPADTNISEDITLPENISSGASVNTAMQIISAKEGYDGNYYNWCAATVSEDCSTATGEVTTSICPAGWRLPSSFGDYSFSNLFSYYTDAPWNLTASNSTNANAVAGVQLAPLSFTKAGGYNSGYYNQGALGIYWSREASSADNAYGFAFNSSNNNFYPHHYGNKSLGRSARCVFMGNSYDETMQTFSADACSALPLDTSKILVDKRDGHQYSVTRLRDGHCWMTSNLHLDGNRTLTPADTNTTEEVTLPENISSGSSVNTAMQIIPAKEGYDGNYYNWCAATLISDCSATTGTAPNSICPASWRLPSNSGDYSFANLFSYYTGSPWNLATSNSVNADAVSGVQLTPLSFSKAGVYNSGYVNQGALGYYWSREVSSSTIAYYFVLNSSNNNFYPQSNYLNKYYGFSVRCLTN